MTNAQSDHAWKKAAARALRHRVKQDLTARLECDRFAGKRWDLVNPATSSKDGKFWFGRDRPGLLRK